VKRREHAERMRRRKSDDDGTEPVDAAREAREPRPEASSSMAAASGRRS
jgi:hypothetical protein